MRYLLLPSVRLAEKNLLPRNPGVYYAVSWLRPWKPLYIGMSGNLNKRWNMPSNPHHKQWRLRQIPLVRLHYKTTPTRANADELESYEIRHYSPPLNGRDESPERFGWRWKLHEFNRRVTHYLALSLIALAIILICTTLIR